MLKNRLAKMFIVIMPWSILVTHVGTELGWDFLTRVLLGGLIGGICSALTVSLEDSDGVQQPPKSKS